MPRILRAGQICILLYGGVVHVAQVVNWPPYPWAPGWLATYFVSLTLFDPLAAVLLWQWRRSGAWLAAAVLVTDAAANGYATYGGFGVGGTVPRISQAVITGLALITVAALPVMLRACRSARPPASR